MKIITELLTLFRSIALIRGALFLMSNFTQHEPNYRQQKNKVQKHCGNLMKVPHRVVENITYNMFHSEYRSRDETLVSGSELDSRTWWSVHLRFLVVHATSKHTNL